jgi:HPr kinase/phosphorylase
VAFDGRGVLIMGPSGSGKSTLALQLMALGARWWPTTAPS